MLSKLINEDYLANLEPESSTGSMEVMNMEASIPARMEEVVDMRSCCGTFGTFGCAGACCGTFGTFGCAG